jgi:hypothetical protein
MTRDSGGCVLEVECPEFAGSHGDLIGSGAVQSSFIHPGKNKASTATSAGSRTTQASPGTRASVAPGCAEVLLGSRCAATEMVGPDGRGTMALWGILGRGKGLTFARPLSGSSRGQDLNLRPLGYEPSELPDCSTPHHEASNSSHGAAIHGSGMRPGGRAARGAERISTDRTARRATSSRPAVLASGRTAT